MSVDRVGLSWIACVRDTREDRTPYVCCAATPFTIGITVRAHVVSYAGIQGRFTLDRDNSALAGKHGTSPHIRNSSISTGSSTSAI
jgi:hypothetical protein